MAINQDVNSNPNKKRKLYNNKKSEKKRKQTKQEKQQIDSEALLSSEPETVEGVTESRTKTIKHLGCTLVNPSALSEK